MSAEVDREFTTAVEQIKNLPGENTLSNGAQLEFYGLFKQATKGDVTGPKPWNPIGRAKFGAHEECRGMSSAAAKGKYVDALLRLLQSNTDPKAKAIVAIIRPPKKTAAAHKPAPTRAANGAARAVNGGGPAASVSVAEPTATAAAIHATGATRTSITPTKKGGFSNGDEPLSMSTPLKPPKFTDESDAASLGAISDQSETFHDSIDTVDASALAGADANGVTSTETTPVPGPAAADGDSEVARTLDNLQRELNSTTNRVRELEFLLRSSPGRASTGRSASGGLFSGPPAQVAAIFLWPIVVHYGLTWAQRPPPRR